MQVKRNEILVSIWVFTSVMTFTSTIRIFFWFIQN